MEDVEISGEAYRIGKLDVRKQLHVARRLGGLPLGPLLGDAADSGPIGEMMRSRAHEAGITAEEVDDLIPRLLPSLSVRSLGMLSQDDCDYVINTCLGVVRRRQGATYVAVINANGAMQFADIGLSELIAITVAVLRENLGSFFAASTLKSNEPLTQTNQL